MGNDDSEGASEGGIRSMAAENNEKRRGMVCRDFMRNSCLRGVSCKFQHPESQTKVYSFCHDFQNGECRRSNLCRFIHSSREDENYYKRTGELPPHLVSVPGQGHNPHPENGVDDSNGIGQNGMEVGGAGVVGLTVQAPPPTPHLHPTHPHHLPPPTPPPHHHNNNHHHHQQQQHAATPPMTFNDQILAPAGGLIPVCRQFLWNECWRENCKYRHLTMSEYRKLRMSSVLSPSQPSPPLPYLQLPLLLGPGVGGGDDRRLDEDESMEEDDEEEEVAAGGPVVYRRHRRLYGGRRFGPELKRRRPGGDCEDREREMVMAGGHLNLNHHLNMAGPPRHCSPSGVAPAVAYENGSVAAFAPRPVRRQDRTIMMLEEENMLLRQRLGELKKRVDDLQATNEFLLEQNAQLRINEKGATAGLTTVTVPAVTITNTVPPGAGQMQQAPTPQQMVNAAIRTVTASVATVPVSIAAVTPVSIAAVSMAPVQMPPPPPVVTMAVTQPQPQGPPPPRPPPDPTQQQQQQQQQGEPPPGPPQAPPPPPPPQLTALPMSMSGPSASLVSYPLMSRAVIQAADLRTH